MKSVCLLAALSATFLCASFSIAQEDKDSIPFSTLRVNHADELVLRQQGDFPRLEFMEGSVDLKLESEDAAQDIRIRAERIDFEYVGDDARPAMMQMTGNVIFNAETVEISADSATIDLNTEHVLLEGNANAVFENGTDMKSDEINYDMKSGQVHVRNIQATVNLNSADDNSEKTDDDDSETPDTDE